MLRLIFPFLLLAAPPALAQAPATVTSAAVDAQGLETRLTIAVDASSPPRHFTLAGPDRFVVDVPAARVRLEHPPAGAGLVQRIRHGPRPDGAARLVFDLSGPVQVRRESGAAGKIVYVLSPAAGGPSPPAPPRHVVVIDAGHGGHDPGATGVGGAREEAVVLAAALRLREELEARAGYHVLLTRDGDAFLPLDDRVRLARENRADLFISLHADSSPSPGASGASVYTLSERRGARARANDEAQNWDMDLGEAIHSPQVQRILVDLARRETTNRSADFAQALIAALAPTAPLLRNSHRNAGFAVLLAPDVPAVLLEMGFMTNTQDEARLTDPLARARMMGAVADAIDVYFARSRAYASR